MVNYVKLSRTEVVLFIKNYLHQKEGERGNSPRVIDGGDKAGVRLGSETAQIVEGGVALRLHKQHPFGVAVDLDAAAIIVPSQPPGEGVELNEGPAERGLHQRRIEEVDSGVAAAVIEDVASVEVVGHS